VLKRIREARDFLGLSQPAFAEQIEISRERLANYETARTPLPCDLAMRICNQFILSERWLATGKGPMRQYLGLTISPRVFRLPYGEAYDQDLAQKADSLAAKFEDEGTLFAMSPISYWNPRNRRFYQNFFDAVLNNWMDKLEAASKGDECGDLIEHLVNQGQECFEKLLDRELRHDKAKDVFYWVSKTTGESEEIPEAEEHKRLRQEDAERSMARWDAMRERIRQQRKASKP
jgi:transcriptional regulator with XRE-family HTH domain